MAATQALICMQIPSCAKVLSKQVAWALAKGKKGDEGEERGRCSGGRVEGKKGWGLARPKCKMEVGDSTGANVIANDFLKVL